MDNAQNGQQATKFCKNCGSKIPVNAVICTHCGCQVEELKRSEQPSIVINNANTNSNTNTNINNAGGGRWSRPLSKWKALALCIFFGFIGAHKFYEGKNGMGALYIFTFGLFGIGWFIDFISLIFKPNPYYVK